MREWKYKVGDYIKVKLNDGKELKGTIKQIIDDPMEGIAIIILDNGWRVYPHEYQYLKAGDKIVKHISKKFKTIDDLPLRDSQKRYVLQWLAWKFYDILLKLNVEDGYCKSYDPLLIEEDKYHTYIFGDEGRHFKYKTLHEIEEKLVGEMVKILKEESID